MIQNAKKTHRLPPAVCGVLYTILGAALIVAVWWGFTAAQGNRLLFPTPADTLDTLATCLKEAWFWRAFAGSVLRALLSFFVALFAAGLCAFLGKVWHPVKYILAPVAGTVRSLPTMSVILILGLWVGGDYTPVVVAGLVVFPVLYSGLLAAMEAIPRELEETGRLYAGRTYRFFKATLPLLMPSFSLTMSGALGLTLKLTVAAEVLAQTMKSLGLLMQQSSIVFDMGRLMALTAVVIITSLAFEGIVWVVRRLCGWTENE